MANSTKCFRTGNCENEQFDQNLMPLGEGLQGYKKSQRWIYMLFKDLETQCNEKIFHLL